MKSNQISTSTPASAARVEDRLLDVAETAEMTRLSPNTLAYFRSQGKGPSFGKLGRRIFYRESDVRAWIDAQFTSGGAK